MQNQKENLFNEKFNLLNSQEHSEEISWSSSPSSDMEQSNSNTSYFKRLNTPRDRRKKKRTLSKNISNLNSKVIKDSTFNKHVEDGEKSPILCRRNSLNLPSDSSILQPHKRKYESECAYISLNRSPILSGNSSILHSQSYKVRKNILDESNIANISKQSITNCLDVREKNCKKNSYDIFDIDSDSSQDSKTVKIGTIISKDVERTNSKGHSKLHKVSYFDSNFSSERSSASSISEELTPKNSSTSDNIQIFTCKSDKVNPILESVSSIDNKAETKKCRYKKDGLAYRLSNLLKKQNANVNLWRHEKFLAGNANFLIPKIDCLVFLVKSVEMKFGCYLLNVIDENGACFIVIINKEYVLDNILCDSIFKLYKPYNMLKSNNMNLITNICKFEHHLMKN